ncbi:UNVERIFIED_CONTAM: hypothetical protein GTU68_011998 [Idotea baltica]|nr:hypothetical protein [Idotea baltica]
MPQVADLSREIACPHSPVCGVDEVGRGPWAGPLVAGAAILLPDHGVEGIADSKSLTRVRREYLADQLHKHACVAIGVVEVAEIDLHGLTVANDLAMARAVAALPERPQYAFVDGKRMPMGLGCQCETLIKGDALSLSIAAASIVAKVARDRMMAELAKTYPQYGWETNAGYGVAAHRKALSEYGVTPHHRRCFAPIREILLQEQRLES